MLFLAFMHSYKAQITLLLIVCVSSCGEYAPEAAKPHHEPFFTGSSACVECHDDQYRMWRNSHHQLAMQVANDHAVLGDFSDVRLEHSGAESRFLTRGNKYLVRTQNEIGETQDYRVTHTIGVYPLQQYLVDFPGGRMQTLPFVWDARPAHMGGRRWFHVSPDEPIAVHDSLHWTSRGFNWNYMCAECHSTNVQLGYDTASNSFDTDYSEISVGCEACHGPGSTHIRQAELGQFDAKHGLLVNLDDRRQAKWSMNPETGIATRSTRPMALLQQPESCGRCHSRRTVIAPIYEYGEQLGETHLPALLEDSLYFPDGQIQDEVYVYGSFVQSRMYHAGVTCSDCHDPHSLELRTGSEPNRVCAQCHLPDKFSSMEHSRHSASEAGCVDCHMRSRTFMGVDDRRDHSFRVPRPDLTATVGTPNACGSCHNDHTAEWAAAAISRWRPDYQPKRHFAPAIAAGRSGYANRQLLDVVGNADFPPVVRGTALTLLRHPISDYDIAAMQRSLSDADPLVRIGALRALQRLPVTHRAQIGIALLNDPVRAVRIEAAATYVGIKDILSVHDSRAFSRAAEEFRKAHGYAASQPEARLSLGNFDLAGGDAEAAIDWYLSALRLDPDFIPAYANLADALRQRGDESGAEQAIREGLVRDQSNAALRHALGLALARIGRQDEALDELKQAAQSEKENARYTYVYGVALSSLGREREAIDLLTKARAAFPGDYDISWALATMLRDENEIPAAIEIAKDLKARFPQDTASKSLLHSLSSGQD